MYLTTQETCAFVHLTRSRIEQLIRDPESEFPRPFQPMGPTGRRLFKRDELIAWIERDGAQRKAA